MSLLASIYRFVCLDKTHTLIPGISPCLIFIQKISPAQFPGIGSGVGFAAAFGTFRLSNAQLVQKLPIYKLVIFPTCLALLFTLICPYEAQGLAWDAGAVTTGPITVPVILALGAGLKTTQSQFGIVTLASLFPVIGVTIAAIIVSFLSEDPTDVGAKALTTTTLKGGKSGGKSGKSKSRENKDSDFRVLEDGVLEDGAFADAVDWSDFPSTGSIEYDANFSTAAGIHSSFDDMSTSYDIGSSDIYTDSFQNKGLSDVVNTIAVFSNSEENQWSSTPVTEWAFPIESGYGSDFDTEDGGSVVKEGSNQVVVHSRVLTDSKDSTKSRVKKGRKSKDNKNASTTDDKTSAKWDNTSKDADKSKDKSAKSSKEGTGSKSGQSSKEKEEGEENKSFGEIVGECFFLAAQSFIPLLIGLGVASFLLQVNDIWNKEYMKGLLLVFAGLFCFFLGLDKGLLPLGRNGGSRMVKAMMDGSDFTFSGLFGLSVSGCGFVWIVRGFSVSCWCLDGKW